MKGRASDAFALVITRLSGRKKHILFYIQPIYIVKNPFFQTSETTRKRATPPIFDTNPVAHLRPGWKAILNQWMDDVTKQT